MKRIFLIIPISICLALPACKKVSGPADGNSVQPNNNLDSTISINATINGRTWQSDSAFGYYVKYSGNDSGVVGLQITATQTLNDTLSSISFYISNYTGPSIYTIDPPINTATYYNIGNNRNFARSGQINITSDTAYSLRGTFYFTADTFTISSGKFNVALP
jgi:hypothetical protein